MEGVTLKIQLNSKSNNQGYNWLAGQVLGQVLGLVKEPILLCRLFLVCAVICVLSSKGFAQSAAAQELSAGQERKVVVVLGAAGDDSYGDQFKNWAERLKQVIDASRTENPNLKLVRVGGKSETDGQRDGKQKAQTDLALLEKEIESALAQTQELWIILIGHGTDDGTSSKFNLRGPDLTAKQLSQWLAPLPCRCVIVNCSSASGSFINKLKSEDRIVVTATKSSAQYNFARFGEHFLQAIGDPAFDLDKDQQISLLEAFVAGSKRTQEFYEQEGRLATELAVIDDNGDGLGTPADWFEGTRAVRKPKQGLPDGLVANQMFLIRRGAESKLSIAQRRSRDELEAKLESIRLRKDALGPDEYCRELEPVLIELARIYQAIEGPSVNQSE